MTCLMKMKLKRITLLNDKVSNKPFVYMWQYKANNVNEDILKNPLLESHQRILQNNGYLYYIGRHQDTNPNYAHSSNTVEALGLPKKVDYDNLPPGWKRRIIFIGEDYKQVQDKEAKLLETAYYDHDWDKYLNKAWWHKDHLFGGAGETHPKYKDGKRGGKNRHNSEVHSAYQKERYQEKIKDPEWVKKQSVYRKERYQEKIKDPEWVKKQSAYQKERYHEKMEDPEWVKKQNAYQKERYYEKMEDPEYRKKYYARKKRERLAREKRQIEEATPPFDKSILKYLYVSESVYLGKNKLNK